ncbi:MAG: type II toxin-antitoxin system VapC family toxin [Candidatus Kapabacteria bacterium]|nr:type II toxin-antitoxin system VapC family toxin [Ignavibacteriota bacterium]MCW5886219.1 type II toxin-antitoxin system VapC family toxin [Candidatus Kapabacteria bacterium]
MIILDSSAWLEYFAGTKNGDIFAEFAEDFENLLVPSICIFEVYKRILIQRDENSANMAIEFMKNGNVVDINAEIAVISAQLSFKLKLPMADSLIYATGQIFKSKIITQDSDFIGLDNVDYYEKSN